MVDKATIQQSGKAKWTVMVYMAGDNNLDGAALRDIEEMAQGWVRPNWFSTVVKIIDILKNSRHCISQKTQFYSLSYRRQTSKSFSEAGGLLAVEIPS